MASKKSSAWKQRLASMTPAQAEAYKKADNERVAVYRAKRKAERQALKEGGQPPPSPSVSSAPAPKHGPEATTSATTTTTAPEPSRSLFTRYIGICEQSRALGLRPVAEAFHRSDFFEMGLRPTDDVRPIPDIAFSSGERLHTHARLYQATNEQRLVFLGVDDRAEEAAGRFVATQTRYSEALRTAIAPEGQTSTSKNAKRRKHATATANDNAGAVAVADDDSRAS